jgi:hypothetical protein
LRFSAITCSLSLSFLRAGARSGKKYQRAQNDIQESLRDADARDDFLIMDKKAEWIRIKIQHIPKAKLSTKS